MILVLSIIATISAVVSAYCDVRGLRREKRMIEQDSSVPRLSTPRRHYVVMGLFLLLISGAVAFDYYGYHDALQWPDPYQPISVVNKAFRNEEVLLDGYSYDHCTFENVTFVYNGTTAPQMMFPTIRGSFNLRSDNVAVEGTLAMLKGFGMLQPDVNMKFSNPNNIVRAPGEPAE